MNYNKPDSPQSKIEENGRRARQKRARREEKGKGKNRRWLFIAVDVVLLAAIVAAVLFLVSLLTPFSIFRSNDIEEREITYTLEIKGMERDAVETLSVGDVVTDLETGAEIGVITAVHSRPYTEYAGVNPDPAGGWLVNNTTYPDDYNTVTITVAVTADYQSGVGYTVADCRIAVGKAFELSFPGYTGSGVCVSFEQE